MAEVLQVLRQSCIPLDARDLSGYVVRPTWRDPSCQRAVVYWFENDTYTTIVPTKTSNSVIHVFEAYILPDDTLFLADVLVFQRRWVVRCCVSERIERIRKFLYTHPSTQPDTITPCLWFEYPSKYRSCCIHGGSVRVLPSYPVQRVQQLWFYRDLFPYTPNTLCFSQLRSQYGTIVCWPALYGLKSVNGQWQTARGVIVGRSRMSNGLYYCSRDTVTKQWCTFGYADTAVDNTPPEEPVPLPAYSVCNTFKRSTSIVPVDCSSMDCSMRTMS